MTMHVRAISADSHATEGHGVVFVHSTPRAMAPHIEWALAGVFGVPVDVQWAPQPVSPGTLRAEFTWSAPVGTGARLASALMAFAQVRHEVTEDASRGRTGERFTVTPTLGLLRADIGPYGDVMVSEERLRSLLAAGGPSLAESIARLIGDPWDAELEPFRHASAGSSVRILHEVV